MTIWPLKPIPANIDKQLLIDRINLGCKRFYPRYLIVLDSLFIKGISIPYDIIQESNKCRSLAFKDYTTYDPEQPWTIIEIVIKKIRNANIGIIQDDPKKMLEKLRELSGPDSIPMVNGSGRPLAYLPKELISASIDEESYQGNQMNTLRLFAETETGPQAGPKKVVAFNIIQPDSKYTGYNNSLLKFILQEYLKKPQIDGMIKILSRNNRVPSYKDFRRTCPGHVLSLLEYLNALRRIEDVCNAVNPGKRSE